MCKESAHKSLSELLLSEASQQSRYYQLEHKNTLVNNDLRLYTHTRGVKYLSNFI